VAAGDQRRSTVAESHIGHRRLGIETSALYDKLEKYSIE
jgi:hypothetical protein